MSKILNMEVICACCKQKVKIERRLSFSSDKVSLDGNKHHPMQYKLEECPECHYIAIDIGDPNIKVSKGMLNAFHMKNGCESIQDSEFIALMKAADVYEKNKKKILQSYVLRLASFYADDRDEVTLSRELLRRSNAALQAYFEEREELTLGDVSQAINLVDGNRKLGMFVTAENMTNDLLAMLSEVEDKEAIEQFCRILEFEKKLIQNRDFKEHLTSEVM